MTDPLALDFSFIPAWVSYLNMSVLIGTLAVALFNASKDPIARNFAYVYAVISVGILVCSLDILTLLKKNNPFHCS